MDLYSPVIKRAEYFCSPDSQFLSWKFSRTATAAGEAGDAFHIKWINHGKDAGAVCE